MTFKVIVTGYNCPAWIGRGLASVRDQDIDEPFEVCMIDDGSTDPEQQSEILAIANDVPKSQTWHVLLRGSNKKATFSVRQAVVILDPKDDDILVLLDGDDYLAPHCLRRYRELYRKDRRLWLTYGNYEPVPHSTGQQLAVDYDSETWRRRTFRDAPVCINHPYSFKYSLFKHIKIAEMQDDDGNWFIAGMDLVYLYPMLEMAGAAHARFVDETLYYYNAINPNSETHLQADLPNPGPQIRARPKRDLLRR